MKTILLSLFVIFNLSQAQAEGIDVTGGTDVGSADFLLAKSMFSTFTLKSDVHLEKKYANEGSRAETCVDLKTRQQFSRLEDCAYNDKMRRCQVIVYNLNKDSGEMIVPAGTQFRVTDQKGPKIYKDWSEKTSSLILDSDVKGSGHEDPRLIVVCTQTKSGLGSPSKFSAQELQQGLSEILILK